ncbi:hypothetical protein EYR40_001577 [Pleurotus pulmonarius]|nr:hypothetical protein EYR36_000069 [Pleurotus pulmonarius]KAF4604398.1 hypothetical protein EYR38_004820 [Pleurotus pulmonarius]KAF4609224.1 hypothetical protein EYR40_001577 [Pleurotus pulmonarius]
MNVARRSRSLVLASTSYALFSIPIAVTLKLDGRPPEVVDLQTTVVLNIYESEASAARWGATGLDNVSHSLVVTYGKPLNNTRGPAPYTIVDGFIYTVEDETSTAGTDGNASKSSSTPLIAGHVGGLGSASLIAGISLFATGYSRSRYIFEYAPNRLYLHIKRQSNYGHLFGRPLVAPCFAPVSSQQQLPSTSVSVSNSNATPFTKVSAAATSSSSSVTAPTMRTSASTSPLAEGFHQHELAPPAY